MDNYTFEVAEDIVVRIYPNGSGIPVIRQPQYPNGEPWEDAEAAGLWAQAWIAEQTDPEAPEAPEGPGLEGRPKPVEESEETAE